MADMVSKHTFHLYPTLLHDRELDLLQPPKTGKYKLGTHGIFQLYYGVSTVKSRSNMAYYGKPARAADSSLHISLY
jgi:hypothetical protein